MKKNILFLLIDSLRQDQCYGDKKTSITPNLDLLIRDGMFFSQAISPSSITIPSLSSIFSGLYPFESTTLDHELFNMNPDTPSFIKILNDFGYHTSAFIPEAINHTNIPKIFSEVELFDSFATLYDGVGDRILSKIKNFDRSPWFLYVHLEDLHGNAIFHLQDGPKEFQNTKYGKNQYARMLSAMDPWIGKIKNIINTKDTLLVITADHGSTSADFTESMHAFSLNNAQIRNVEPGLIFKSAHKLMNKLPEQLTPFRKKLGGAYTKTKNKKIENKLLPELEKIESFNLTPYQKRLLKKSVNYPRDCYDENFRPSLIFYGCDVPKNKIITKQVSSLDIFPTMLNLVATFNNNLNRGIDLTPLFRDENFEERPLMLDGSSSELESKISDTIGIRTSKFKYFRDRFDSKKNVHLFDIQKDPLEENNIFDENKSIVDYMEEELKKINSTKNFSFKKLNELSKTDEEKAKDILKKLGYI